MSYILQKIITRTTITKRIPTTTTLLPSSSSSSSSYRSAHTIRVILTKDIPDKNQYAGETITVKAGYARNFLIPKKIALYATPQNFNRVGIEDPELVRGVSRANASASASVSPDVETDEDAKAADFLRYYLRNKTLKIWRNVDVVNVVDVNKMENAPIYPGFVDHKNVRDKLSKQLKIDLEDHEKVQIRPTPVSFGLMDDDETLMESLMDEMDPLEEEGQDQGQGQNGKKGGECQVKLKALGEYLVKIHLRGGHSVGLRLNVVRR